MRDFDRDLAAELAAIDAQGLRRRLRAIDSPQGTRIRINGQELLNFSSNDYLGFASHPALKEAALRAVTQYGAGSGASRLICGSLTPHEQLDQELAAFKRTDSALAFSSGYGTALGTICALVAKDDVIVLDRLVHASIVDAARLSGAKLRVFAHNDIDDLERILRWAVTRNSGEAKPTVSRPRRILVVTESLFSMDGDQADLGAIVELKDRYGAWLMLDEAHATGLYGSSRRGLVEAHGVSDRVEIHMGTLGKALGAAGGYICGSRYLIELLINRARSFIFSTAPVPASAAAASAGIQLLKSGAGEERCRLLWQRVAQFYGAAPAKLLKRDGSAQSAIIPVQIGDEAEAVKTAARLQQQGFFIPAIRYPTVARGQARLRVTLTANHSSDDVARLVSALFN